MGTAITPIQRRVAKVRELFGAFRSEIAHALPRHLTADRMIELLMLNVRQTPKLLECDESSLIGAVLECVRLGLEPGDHRGLAYLIPFHNSKRGVTEVQFVAGYRGLIDLAYRSGLIAKIDVRAVFQGDDFRYAYGLEPMLQHVPSSADDDPAKLTHVYAIVKIKGGDAVFDVLGRERVEQIRRCSRSGQSPASPWNTHFTAMAKKTVIRQLLKTVPCSAELQKAITLDELADANVSQRFDMAIDVEAEQPAPPPPELDDLNRRLREESGTTQKDQEAREDAEAVPDDIRAVSGQKTPPRGGFGGQERRKIPPKAQNRQNQSKNSNYPPHEMASLALQGRHITAEEFDRLILLPTEQQPAELDRILDSSPAE